MADVMILKLDSLSFYPDESMVANFGKWEEYEVRKEKELRRLATFSPFFNQL